MNKGDTILVCSDYAEPNSITRHKVIKVNKDTVQCEGEGNIFYLAFCWPLSAEEQLISALEERKKLKTELDNSMKLIYELRNSLSNY